MSIAENLITQGFATLLLAPLDPSIDVTAPIRGLRVAQRQLVEIAKALRANAKIIAMDEPTASLTPKEFEKPVEVISSLKAQGVSTIYVSHKMDAVYRVCQSATILRDGRMMAHLPIPQTPVRQVIETMVGRALAHVSHHSHHSHLTANPPDPEDSMTNRSVLSRLRFRDAGTLLGLVLISAVFATLSPVVLTGPNLLNILQQSSINACIALGIIRAACRCFGRWH